MRTGFRQLTSPGTAPNVFNALIFPKYLSVDLVFSHAPEWKPGTSTQTGTLAL
jgi:hypothetical protein